MRNRLLASSVLAVLATASCSLLLDGLEGTLCNEDGTCGGGLVCKDGRCLASGGEGPADAALGGRDAQAEPPDASAELPDAGEPDAAGCAPGLFRCLDDDLDGRPDHCCKADSLALGGAHSCAVVSNNGVAAGVQCWGANLSGQLGRGNVPLSYAVSPGEVEELGQDRGAVDLEAGDAHTCAAMGSDSPEVLCWGKNDQSQIGPNSSPRVDEPFAVPIPGLVPTQVAAGAAHSCALGSDGDLRCWGSNVEGEIGVGSKGGVKPVAQQVTFGGFKVRSVAAGSGFTCAVDSGPAAHCWGRGEEGQLGIGPGPHDLSRPGAHVSFGEVDPLVPASPPLLSARGHHACAAARRDGKDLVACWGTAAGVKQEFATAVAGLPQAQGIVDLAVGLDHACAILATATGEELWCWGSNAAGQVGHDGGPARILPNVSFARVAAGDRHTCAIAGDGRTWCWGDGSQGQLANGSPVAKGPPALVVPGH